MAKSLEDTAFYRYHRLIALNEVGGEPDAPALTLPDFHARMQARAQNAPAGLTATATHDTKRGEDARARILALSEIPDAWEAAVGQWAASNSRFAQERNGRRWPSKGHEYMLYQALIGAWIGMPDQSFVARMQAYALKAAREGKQETSWTNPNEAYETALQEFVASILDPRRSADFIASFDRFAARTTLLGALNSLSQLALKALLPGVPDFYQGTELWDLSLVDPDNRRPVDFSVRARELSAPESIADVVSHWSDGRLKLAVARELLRLRQQHAALFQQGAYAPISVSGPHAEHVLAFARTFRDESVLVAVGRHFAALTNGGLHWPTQWQGTLATPSGEQYRDALGAAGHNLELSVLFQTIPIAVLVRA
jgi:(1->4)-alpha-D-glucan 1-alpha-D-glucosylmutase